MRRNLGDSLGFDVDHQYQLRQIRYPDGQAMNLGYDWNGNRTKLIHPMGRGVNDSFTYSGNRVANGASARKGTTIFRHDARGNLSLEASYAMVADTTDMTKAWRVVERRFSRRNELERARIITRLERKDTTWLRFEYGDDGNRIASFGGRGGDTSSWTPLHKWVYDGSVIAADSGSDHGWTWHVYNGLNRAAEATDSAGKTRVRYVLTDHQGTTQALLSDTGVVLGRWIWDPWGNIEESWTQRTTELLYQGKPYETALSEWYFNARWYSPERGSFTGRDPKLQFWTPYSYVGNGPITGTDPDGMDMYTIKDGGPTGPVRPLVGGGGGSREYTMGPGGTVFPKSNLPPVTAKVSLPAPTVSEPALHAPTTTAVAPFYPPNNGAAGSWTSRFLLKGELIDRRGGSGFSKFFAPAGTPDLMRALPPGASQQPLRLFEVLKPFEVLESRIAPAFGDIGGGKQYLSPVKLEVLLNRGILGEVGPTR